jgi:hypothetical protein
MKEKCRTSKEYWIASAKELGLENARDGTHTHFETPIPPARPSQTRKQGRTQQNVTTSDPSSTTALVSRGDAVTKLLTQLMSRRKAMSKWHHSRQKAWIKRLWADLHKPQASKV